MNGPKAEANLRWGQIVTKMLVQSLVRGSTVDGRARRQSAGDYAANAMGALRLHLAPTGNPIRSDESAARIALLWSLSNERLMLSMAGFEEECAENIQCEGCDAREFEHCGRRQHGPGPLRVPLIG